MNSFLCVLEALNLDTLFSDCHDLSTTRGGGLAVLKIGESVAKTLSDETNVRTITASASQGILIVDGESADSVEKRVRVAAKSLPLMEHISVLAAACEHNENEFAARLAQLKTRIRFSQMRSPSVIYPQLHDHRVCEIDGVRPASRRHSNLSIFTHERRELGREKKNTLLGYPVASDLNKIADANGLNVGNTAGKLAVLRFDGNSFGRIVESSGQAKLKEFSEARVSEQSNYILSLFRNSAEWLTPAGDVRLEVVVYGGDEVTIIVPAWLGWKALLEFYKRNFDPGISYSGGLVFCHSNAPIHSIKRLASELTDKAKEYAEASKVRKNKKGNLVVYQPLESFDAIGRKLDDWMARRYRPSIGGLESALLGIDEIAVFDEHMGYWKKALSKRRLYRLVADIYNAKTNPSLNLNATLESLLEARGSSLEKRAFRELSGWSA